MKRAIEVAGLARPARHIHRSALHHGLALQIECIAVLAAEPKG